MLSTKVNFNFLGSLLGLLLLASPDLSLAEGDPGREASRQSINCVFSPWLSCLDTSDGALLWHQPAYSDPSRFVIHAGQLYISNSATVTSHDLASGEVIWQASNDNGAHYFYPVVDHDSLYLARSDGKLDKYLATTGQLLWSRHLGEGWIYPPLLVDQRLVTAGQDRTLWVLDSTNGAGLEHIQLDQELVAPLFQLDQLIIASTFDGQLQAWQAGSSQDRLARTWHTRLSTPAFSFIDAGGSLIAADMGGKLHAIDSRSGETRWQQQVHHNPLYWNTLHEQRLISLGESGVLTILDIDTGKRQHLLRFPGRYDQAPSVQGQALVLYDQSGTEQRVTAGELFGMPDNMM